MILPPSLFTLLVTALLIHFVPKATAKLVAFAGILVSAWCLWPSGAFFWDGVGVIFSMIFLFFTSLVILFSELDRERISLLVASAFALVGAAGTRDLFSFYLLWELACLASYYIAFSQGSKEPAFRYLIASIVSSSFIFLGIAITFAETNSVAFSAVSQLSRPYLVSSLFLVGFGLRALVFPLQFWVPDLYASLQPASAAYFAGVLNKLGILAILRLLEGFSGVSDTLLLLSLATVLAGNLMAFVQRDIKRLLAFSSITHVGYLLMGFSFMTPGATASALIHTINHAAAITLLFLALDSNMALDRLKLPTFRRYALIVGGLSLAGFPGLSVFAGELSLLSNVPTSFAVFAAINMAFSAVYYYRLLSCGHTRRNERLTALQLLVLLLLGAFIIGSGVFPMTGRTMMEMIA